MSSTGNNGGLRWLEDASFDRTVRLAAEDALKRYGAQVRQKSPAVGYKSDYHALVEGLPDAVVRIGRDTTILDVHAPDPGILVLPPEQLVGRRIQDHLESSIADRFIRAIGETLATGVPQQIEYRLPVPTGKMRDLEARVTPRSADEVLVIIRDITERKTAEEDLHRIRGDLENSEARWKLLVESHPDPIIVSIGGKIVYTNQATAKLLGAANSEEVKDLSFYDVIPVFYHEVLGQRLSAIEKGERVGMFEFPVHTLKGEVRYIESSGTLIAFNGKTAILTVARDITERKRIEQALRHSQEYLGSIIDALTAHIAVLDETGTILDTNSAWRRFAEANGGSVEGLEPGANYLDVCDRAQGEHSEGASAVGIALRKLIAGHLETFEIEYPCHSPLERQWFTLHANRFVVDDAVRVVVAHENITARKKITEALEEREKMQRLLLEALPDVVLRVHATGRVLDGRIPHNFPFQQIAEGSYVQGLLPSSYSSIIMEYIEDCLTSERVQEWKVSAKLGDLPVGFEVRFIPSAKDEVLVMVRDVSQERRLESQVLEAVALEQRRIGQDLHDGLGQQLVGLHYMTSTLAGLLEGAPPKAHEIADRVRAGIKQAIDQARTLAHGLNPVELEKEGLVYTLREMAQNLERVFGVTCRFSVRGEVHIDQSVVAYHLYRITQEAINNALKHAGASIIEIEIVETKEMRVLSIHDNGRGFSMEVPRKGMGLHTMQYRANLIGASLHIRSKPGDGTIVSCQMPLSGTLRLA